MMLQEVHLLHTGPEPVAETTQGGRWRGSFRIAVGGEVELGKRGTEGVEKDKRRDSALYILCSNRTR
jgi:hypothetical protein